MNIIFEKTKYFFQRLIQALFFHDHWNIGIINQPIHSILSGDIKNKITWLPDISSNQFSADPFGISVADKDYIFYEHFDYKKFQGQINCLEVSGKKLVKKYENVFPQISGHTSYPYVFECLREIYCIPETQENNKIELYKAVNFPDKWKKVSTLIDNFPGVDSTIIFRDGLWWIFTTKETENKNKDLYIFYAQNLYGPWTAHQKNPVKSDIKSARPAGTPFIWEKQLYRPAQDCEESYGQGIAINKITKLTTHDWEEETIKFIYPAKNNLYNQGFHTVSSLGNSMLIDSKKSVFSLWAFFHFFKRNIFRLTYREKRSGGKVLVLGENSQSFLSVIRSLGRKNIEVHTAWCPKDSLALYSRYIYKNHIIAPYSLAGEWKKDLIDLMKQEQFDLVIPTNDQTIIPLQKNRQELEKYGRIYLLDDDVFQTVFDKKLSNDLAKSLGLNLAKEMKATSLSDVDMILSNFSFPIVLKPQASFQENDLVNRNYVRIAQDREDLLSYLTALFSRGEVLVQEFFWGKGIGIEILAQKGEILYAFSHERVHEPLWGGASSYRKSTKINPELLAASQKLIKALNYTGVAMLEYKVNPITGKWIFIEINGRFWGSLPLSLSSGADFPYYLYEMLVKGKSNFPADYKKEFFCRNTWQDIGWLKKNLRADKNNQQLLTVSLKKLLGELGNIFRLKEYNDTLVGDDFRPGLAELGQIVKLMKNLVMGKIKFVLYNQPLIKNIIQKQLAKKIQSASQIAFICQGNICRSPFAEKLLKNKMDNLPIVSAGYYPEKGRPCPLDARESSKFWGLDLEAHRSLIVDENILSGSDLVFVFTQEDYQVLVSRYPHYKHKLYLLGLLSGDKNYQIVDPYGKKQEAFIQCYKKIASSIDNLISLMKSYENTRNK